MKYKDIPKLTNANYSTDYSLEHIKFVLDKFIKEYKLQLKPFFQRNKVWSKSTQIKFIEYLLRGGKANTTIAFNGVGWNKANYGQFVLVDGYQRLNSILDFLDNKFKLFKKYYYKDFEYIGLKTKNKFPLTLTINFKINDLEKADDILRWYIEMNEGHIPHKKSELSELKEYISYIECLRNNPDTFIPEAIIKDIKSIGVI